MKPTERLNELLNERGIKTLVKDVYGCRILKWDSPTFGEVSVNDISEDSVILFAHAVTPEQAIEATIPRGTCRYVPDEQGFVWYDEDGVEHVEDESANADCWTASCDHCGNIMQAEDWFEGFDEPTEWTDADGVRHMGYVLVPTFRYCPSCGRKVEEPYES